MLFFVRLGTTVPEDLWVRIVRPARTFHLLFMRRALWAWHACWSALHERTPTGPCCSSLNGTVADAGQCRTVRDVFNQRSTGRSACQAKTSGDHPFNEALITVFITKGDYQSKPTTPDTRHQATKPSNQTRQPTSTGRQAGRQATRPAPERINSSLVDWRRNR